LVEVESADPACSVEGPSLGPPRLPVRPRSQPAVCAVVENGVRTGAMIAGTDAKSIIHSISYGRSGDGSCRCCSPRASACSPRLRSAHGRSFPGRCSQPAAGCLQALGGVVYVAVVLTASSQTYGGIAAVASLLSWLLSLPS
jgi:hypothetical protein